MNPAIESQFLPRPRCCDECASPSIALVDKKEVYGPFSEHDGELWMCLECRAYVSCHEGTDRPMGTMANEATRRARVRAHKAFDPLWKTRRDGHGRRWWYSWLAGQLEVPLEHCHIAMFTQTQCEQVIEACQMEIEDEHQPV